MLAGRVATVALFLLSAALVYLMDTAKGSFDIILQVGAGTGLLYLLRWFWWRVNAWCEVVAMVSSFGISVALLLLKKYSDVPFTTHHSLLITVAFTTVCWVAAAYLAPGTDRLTLVNFFMKVRPFGPGWAPIRKEAGLSDPGAEPGRENIPLALLGWTAGCATVWSSLFLVGNILYGRHAIAAGLAAVLAVSGSVLVAVVKRLWAPGVSRQR